MVKLGNGRFYVQAKTHTEGKKRTIYLHNFIMNTPKGMETLHIDQNETLDNRRSNLKIGTKRSNVHDTGQTSEFGVGVGKTG